MDKEPELFIVAGPNGSGKTTVTKEILHRKWGESGIYINPDDVAQTMFGDWNDERAVKKAADYCQQLRYQCLEQKKNIIFETVLSSEEKVNFIKLAKEKGYFVRIFFIGTESPTINAARITQRFMEGGHSVPIDKVVSRFWKSNMNLKALMPIIDRCYIFDNSEDGVQARLLLKYRDGKLEKKYSEEKVRWTEKLVNEIK